ncbi:MAG: AAA family ATPase [Desulforhopalus sp.]
MRLRYIHLPRCGPLTDAGVVFGRDDLIAKTLDLPRRGSLNFVVGVNGSGKSSLLRALYRIFSSLNHREWPVLPVTLAWDRTIGNNTSTVILHSTNQKKEVSFVATLKQMPISIHRHEWETITAALSKDRQHPLVEVLDKITGTDAITSSLLFSMLPKRIIAYTSGAEAPWVQLDHPIFHPKAEDEGEFQAEDERPQGWSMDQEWEEEQPIRISNTLTRYALKSSDTQQAFGTGAFGGGPFGGGTIGPLSNEAVERLQQELGPLDTIRQKVLMNRMSSSKQAEDSYFLLPPRHLRFAGIILGLWQTAKEMKGYTGESQQEVLRNTFIGQQGLNEKIKDARRVLNEIDWFWSTHLSLTYRDADDRVSPMQHKELLCLLALAEDVITQPLGRQRAVFLLGPVDDLSLTEKLNDVFPFGIPSQDVEFIAKRVDGCKTGAEAILRVLSADQDIDSTPMDVFSRLRDWERTGLLEEITVTIKRLHRPESDNGELNDSIVTYDQLSDGEQMLLGRMGLLFLLRGQNGSLLLLDEPETHFNDVWKREIVEMIDMGLLNSTEANVVVATHTSIALTDAFAAEVTVMDKKESGITARGVKGGLFGTDPGEVNMNLFGADSNIGRRSVELLDRLLKTDWVDRENELEEILDLLGSSFHRAELRGVLKKLRAKNDGTTSS